MNKPFDLVIKRFWFDQIKNGVKKKEFRTTSKHWDSRLLINKRLRYDKSNIIQPDILQFRSGYQPGAMRLLIECLDVSYCEHLYTEFASLDNISLIEDEVGTGPFYIFQLGKIIKPTIYIDDLKIQEVLF